MRSNKFFITTLDTNNEKFKELYLFFNEPAIVNGTYMSKEKIDSLYTENMIVEVFDPFLHGTNTRIFSILSKSEYKIMPILEMIDEFLISPMCGEITDGGYSSIGNASIKDGDMGKTSFGLLSSDIFDLNTIIDMYADVKNIHDNPEDYRYHFRTLIGEAIEVNFSNINLILIYLTCARHFNSLDKIISKELLIKLQKKMDGTLQFFYFIQLIGKYIIPNYKTIDAFNMDNNINYLTWAELTSKKIIKRIIENRGC